MFDYLVSLQEIPTGLQIVIAALRIGMPTYCVALCSDFFNQLRIPLGEPSDDKKGCATRFCLENVQEFLGEKGVWSFINGQRNFGVFLSPCFVIRSVQFICFHFPL